MDCIKCGSRIEHGLYCDYCNHKRLTKNEQNRKPETIPKTEKKLRVCLKCNKKFKSYSKVHRICYRCRAIVAKLSETHDIDFLI
jgi:DNA-directed RNA polymerase subunit RPC12/RpoP